VVKDRFEDFMKTVCSHVARDSQVWKEAKTIWFASTYDNTVGMIEMSETMTDKQHMDYINDLLNECEAFITNDMKERLINEVPKRKTTMGESHH